MARGQVSGVLQWLRMLAIAHGEMPPDQELVRRFVADRDEAAFVRLLQKHGPMVLGVCRRLLADGPDAEEAFQATFLVLAQKAGSIRKRRSVSSWLYGVATRVAGNIRKGNARRSRHIAEHVNRIESVENEVSWREVRAALDEEIAKLPDRLRLPVILCYLDGMTRDEAAAELGWSPTTLRGRLERGRELLRGGLTRRGITLSGALLASLLTQNAQATLPAVLSANTVKAALAIALGKPLAGLVSARIITIAFGELHAMFMHKIMQAAVMMCATVLLVAGVAGGAGALLREGAPDNADAAQVRADEPPAAAQEPIADERDYFVRGTVGKGVNIPADLEKAGVKWAFVLENAKGKELSKKTKIIVAIGQKEIKNPVGSDMVDDVKQERLVGNARILIDPLKEEDGLVFHISILRFRNSIAIERDQIKSVKKDGDTWWVRPKAILVLKEVNSSVPAVLDAREFKPVAGEDELRKLLIERNNSACREVTALCKKIELGVFNIAGTTAAPVAEQVIGSVKRYTAARLDLTSDPAERIAICKRNVEAFEDMENENDYAYRVGRIGPEVHERFIQARLEAQIMLLKEQRGMK